MMTSTSSIDSNNEFISCYKPLRSSYSYIPRDVRFSRLMTIVCNSVCSGARFHILTKSNGTIPGVPGSCLCSCMSYPIDIHHGRSDGGTVGPGSFRTRRLAEPSGDRTVGKPNSRVRPSGDHGLDSSRSFTEDQTAACS